MYQSLNTKDYSLAIPDVEGGDGPYTFFLKLAGVPRAASVLRLAIEAANVDVPLAFTLVTGSSDVDPDVFPLSDAAYAVMDGDVVAGAFAAQFALNQILYILPANMRSQFSNCMYLQVTFDSADPITDNVLKVKLDTAVATST